MKKIACFLAVTLTLSVLIILHINQIAHANKVHRVAPGESLYIIARSHGVTVEDIIRVNPLDNPDIIHVGQAIIIPGQEKTVTYLVQPGDTLFKISSSHGVSLQHLAEVNNIENWDVLQVGQVLTIPGSQPLPEPDPEHTMSQLARMFQGTLYFRGPSHTSNIALTFDDGPDSKYTSQVLDILRDYQVPATFFLIGNRVERFPGIVKRIFAEGHVIGNHSWAHPDLRRVSNDRLISEIQQTEEVLEKITGHKTALIRPPYGLVTASVLEQMEKMNYNVINWSVDSVDWRDQSADQILINTLSDVRGGAILLFHSAGGEGQSMAATVEVLPELIETLWMLGYSFVTVDELLGVSAYK